MKKLNPFWCLVIALLFLLTGSSSVFAKHGGGGKGHGGGPHKTPAGWSHGKKKGWKGEQLPPGLAKKQEGADSKTSANETEAKPQAENS